MDYRGIALALSVAALASGCSNDDRFQSVDIESPFTCGEFTAAEGDFRAHQAFAQQIRLISNEIDVERQVHFYFKNALVRTTEYTLPHYQTFAQNQANVCAKFPSKGINEAIIEAAELTYSERGSELVVQRCSDLHRNQADIDTLARAISAEINKFTEIDIVPDIVDSLNDACSRAPDEMIAFAVPVATQVATQILNEKSDVVRTAKIAEALESFARDFGGSLLVNGDVSCSRYNARANELSRLSGIHNFDYENIVREAEAVINANFSGDEAAYLMKSPRSLGYDCEDSGAGHNIQSYKAAAQMMLDEARESGELERFAESSRLSENQSY